MKNINKTTKNPQKGQELGVVDSREDSDVGMPHWLHLTPSVTERVAMPHAHVGERGLTFSALFWGAATPGPKGSSYQPSQHIYTSIQVCEH